MIYRLILFFLVITAEIFSQYGEVSVKTWAGDKRSAFTFTLDDGLHSQVINGDSILNKYGMRGTFMVIADHLTEEPPGEWRYTSWSVLRELSLTGHEIGSHSMNHPDLTELPAGDTLTPGTAAYEIYASREKINQKVSSQKCFSFAYPLSAHNETVRSITSQYYEAARGAGLTHNGQTFSPDEWYQIMSIPPLFDMPRNSLSDDLPELENHKQLIQNSIDEGGWFLNMLHEIVPQSELPTVINIGLWHPVSSEWLDLLCSWLNQKSESGDLWIATMGEVSRYIKERETFSSFVVFSSENEIRISAADQVDNSIYNYPLTVDITVPASWTRVRVIQGNTNIITEVFQSGDKHFIRTNVIPDGGELILFKNDTAGEYSIKGRVSYHSPLNRAVDNVLAVARGLNNFQASALTDNNGLFSINNLPSGTYNLSFYKSDDYVGVNSTDALHILRYISGNQEFDSLQLLAADVDLSQSIDTTDAELLLQRFTHLRDSFETDDWLFYPANPEVVITDLDINLEIRAIKAGDVSPD